MAAISEFFGGIGLILGLFFRPACILLTIIVLVATASHLSQRDHFGKTSPPPFKARIVLLSRNLTGAGRYSLNEKLNL